jgi:hypothetical protein
VSSTPTKIPKRLCPFWQTLHTTRHRASKHNIPQSVRTFQSSLFLDARNEDSYRRAETGPQNTGVCSALARTCQHSAPAMLLSRFRPGPQPRDQPYSLPTMAAEWCHLPYLSRSSTSPPIVVPTYFQSLLRSSLSRRGAWVSFHVSICGTTAPTIHVV